jgi:hypothetical protein
MRRLISTYSFLLLTALPMVALANPNASSPEPEFWASLALGSLPLLYIAWRQRNTLTPAPITNRRAD